MRLGILTSHPIQYQAPWFRELAKHLDLQVFFAHRQTSIEQAKAGFGVAFEWDVDLLSGYKHTFLTNCAKTPDVNHFSGCDTPEIADMIAKSKQQGGEGSFDAFIVSGWYLKSYWQAIRACRRNKIPVLVRGDSQLLTPRSKLKQFAKEIFYRVALRQFDRFLVVGQRNREYLRHYGVPERKMFFSPHFVDNDWFSTKATEARLNRTKIREAWGVSDQTVVALFVGKFIPKKRPVDLVKALGMFPKNQFLGVLVGSGELQNELEKAATESGAAVRFEGFKNQSELPPYYAAADVLVLPSDGGETWGLVVNEAMACGTPAIVSDAVGCAPDLIDDGKTGFVFPCGDTEALADRLLKLQTLKQQTFDFSGPLRDKMRKYSIQTVLSETVSALSSVTGSSSFPLAQQVQPPD